MSESENSLYCEFVDSSNFVEYYELTSDPFQLLNLASEVGVGERGKMARELKKMKKCRGRRECFRPK